MEYTHPHPINIVENTFKYCFLLLLPFFRVLFFYTQGFYQWVRGAWFDLLIVLLIILFGYIRWVFNTFKVANRGIYVSKGIFIWQKRFIPYTNVATVIVESPFYWMPIRAVRVTLDTNAGGKHRYDVSLTMRREDALNLMMKSQLPLRGNEGIRKTYRPKNFYIGVLSLLTSNSLSGVLFASALISQTGDILGREFENQLVSQLTQIVHTLAFGLPPAAAIVGYTLLGGWLVGFLLGLIHHKNFTASRQGNSLYISEGSLIRRYYSLDVKKIHFVQLRQSLTTKFLGLFMVFVHVSGYGKQKNSLAVLMPAATRREAERNLQLLLPEMPFDRTEVHPHKDGIWGFLFKPLVLIFVFLAAAIFLYWFLPSFRGTVVFMAIMAEIPCIWFLILKITAFSHTGIGYTDAVYTLRYSYAYRLYTVSVPANRVVKVQFKQNPWQHFSSSNHRCTVVVYTYAEGRQRHVLPNMDRAEVEAFFSMHGLGIQPAE
ncbi:MAG TPA: PH domain-containing protein [Firmicutes bacterium]|nr:PH domain-containing protein [Bacillota bacterium]